MLRVSLTLFNLQGTHRLTGRNCIIPYQVTVVKNFFQKFFELSLANLSNPFSHPTARLSHKLFYVTTGFSVCQALFSAHREVFLLSSAASSAPPQTNSVIIPHALAFVKLFFLGRCVFPTACPLLKALSLKRLSSIPKPPSLVNTFFPFSPLFLHFRIRPRPADICVRIGACRWTRIVLRFYCHLLYMALPI